MLLLLCQRAAPLGNGGKTAVCQDRPIAGQRSGGTLPQTFAAAPAKAKDSAGGADGKVSG